MMFRKGNLVEVLRREDDPCGSWYTANILSADCDSYVIRYKMFTDRDGNRVVEGVRGKDVRPLPPYVNNGKNWVVGDVAEVFDVRCWRIGKVAKVLKNNDSFVIKLFGSIQVKEFHASSLRVRQAWHGNKWMVVGESADACQVEGIAALRVSLLARSKDSANNSTPKIPFRAGCLHFKTPLEGIDENFIKLSTKTNNRMEDTNSNCVYHSSRPVWSTENSDQCSVASCSFNGVADNGDRISPQSLENTSNHSDAESSFPSLCVKRNLPSSRADKVVNIHELELRAYKSTVEALYVSGPLTWEQEEMLTNLRLSLNISDEEHLLQLRHLMSAHVL
ncbi:hypothetical protein V6N12_044602 [Hibiscus sabdariffa]|uniref:ENT domain-containing protein n=1 Tax=Hibiscus sabdariffa TaxID=183260 RepID=A0ABR2AXB5_9ROSI